MKHLKYTEEKYEQDYMNQAIKIAFNSTCKKSKCGSIIVKDNEIIATGFNSPPKNLENQRRCNCDKESYDKKVTDKTCCIHAEQRAIIDALKNNPNKILGSRLYFIRLDKEEKPTFAGQPYCTICSKMALDVGISEFVLWHEEGICIYDTEEYNKISFEYKNIMQQKLQNKKHFINWKLIKNFGISITGILTVVVSFYSILTYYNAKKLDRPYLNIEERNGVVMMNNGNDYLIIKASIKNTGKTPANFISKLNGWPCSIKPRLSNEDYISPNQGIEIGYNLLLDCELPPPTNLCYILKKINLEITYKEPGQINYDYLTSFKMKIIPASDDMFHISTTSLDKYDLLIEDCDDEQNTQHSVIVWYTDKMK
ncbi:MAG: hypothetical protein WC070_03375 [Candidatus Magasanikbacteria bacterium]